MILVFQLDLWLSHKVALEESLHWGKQWTIYFFKRLEIKNRKHILGKGTFMRKVMTIGQGICL